MTAPRANARAFTSRIWEGAVRAERSSRRDLQRRAVRAHFRRRITRRAVRGRRGPIVRRLRAAGNRFRAMASRPETIVRDQTIANMAAPICSGSIAAHALPGRSAGTVARFRARSPTRLSFAPRCTGQVGGAANRQAAAARAVRPLSGSAARSDPRRRKVALHVGSGLDTARTLALDRLRQSDGVGHGIRGRAGRIRGIWVEVKEEYLYLRLLANSFDVRRAPHLRSRANLRFPRIDLSAEAGRRLEDFLAAA